MKTQNKHQIKPNTTPCQTSVSNYVKDARYFSVHSVRALKNRSFSIVVANIDNTPEKIEMARAIYPIDDWHFEFHDYKLNIKLTN